MTFEMRSLGEGFSFGTLWEAKSTKGLSLSM